MAHQLRDNVLPAHAGPRNGAILASAHSAMADARLPAGGGGLVARSTQWCNLKPGSNSTYQRLWEAAIGMPEYNRTAPKQELLMGRLRARYGWGGFLRRTGSIRPVLHYY